MSNLGNRVQNRVERYLEHIEDDEKDLAKLEEEQANDMKEGRPLNPGLLEKIMALRDLVGTEATAAAKQIEKTNPAYALALEAKTLYCMAGQAETMGKIGDFANAAQMFENAKNLAYTLAQKRGKLEQEMAAKQQIEKQKGREAKSGEGNEERYARRAGREEEEGVAEEDYEERIEEGRNRLESINRREQMDGREARHYKTSDEKPRGNKMYRHGVNAILLASGVIILALAGMPALTGQLTGAVIGSRITNLGGVVGLVMVLIGLVLLIFNRNRLKRDEAFY